MPTIEVRVRNPSQPMITDSLHVIVWEFEARPDALDAFLNAYGPEGEWDKFFAQSPEFLGVELVQSVQHANRFFTFDHWISSEAFDAFRDQHEQAYQLLDKQLEGLTAWERRIGGFPDE